MSEEQRRKLSPEEEEALFKFDDKTLDDYEDDALIDKGEYALEVDNFRRNVKLVDEDNQKGDQQIGEKIPWAVLVLRHKRDKNGNIDSNLMGRRYEVLFWDLRKESTRDEVGQWYRALGFGGSYVPKYDKTEFIRGTGKDAVRAHGIFYIGRYVDSETKRERNSRPRIVNDRKTKKQEKADAKGPVEL